MANHAEDYDRLVSFLRDLPGSVRIVLEPTGDFHRALAHRLLREGFSVVSVSSVAGAAIGRRCSTPGTRTIQRTHGSSCSCSSTAWCSTTTIHLLTGDHDLQELAKTYQMCWRVNARRQPAQ